MNGNKKNDQVGGYISKVKFNNGFELDNLKSDDIVVFVGPNNAGKSQALKDIYDLCERDGYDTIVATSVSIEKHKTSITELIKRICTIGNQGGYQTYTFLEGGFSCSGDIDEHFRQCPAYDWFRQIFVAKLGTDARLAICDPVNSIRRNDVKRHPIHYVAFDASYRKKLSDAVEEAFGIQVTPNILYGSAIPLCLGPAIKYNHDEQFVDEQERFERYADDLSRYEQVQNQGDGMRSFVGILLYLMMDNYRTYLIDEPESFLHPPQAKLMGKFIAGDLSRNQQVFLSTHSEELIKGLLEEDSQRVKIVRVTRSQDNNDFALLENKDLNALWKEPILKYSNIMSGLFYDDIVLCESDSDCKFYSLVDAYMKQSSKNVSSSQFVHCGGKHRMDVVIKALKSLDINVKVIVDIDVLDDSNIMNKIFCSCGGEWCDIANSYKIVSSAINNLKCSVKIDKKELRGRIESSIIWDDGAVTKDDIKRLREVCKIEYSAWKDIKHSGVSAIPSGSATNAFYELDREARNVGVYIVPVGELEGFVRDIGGHGPDWVNSVLKSYPDFNSPVYNGVRRFLGEMGL